MTAASILPKSRLPFILLFLLLLLQALPVRAAENIAAYPLLPKGYGSIKVFDRDGRFVGRILPETRYWTPIERIPPFLQRALVAVEDARFYEHGGIDVRGIARALVKDVVKGRLAEGGSTITQQLVKNKYLSGEKSIDRKLTEGFMAVELEKQYSKKQILEMYFNEIYFGNGAWGIAQAARLYFDKDPEELTDAECALLAGVPKNPGRYNPFGTPAKVLARRDTVLQRMEAVKMLTAKQRKKLRAQRVTFTPPNQAPYYLAHIKNRLMEKYGKQVVEQGGLEIAAALDLKLQQQAERSLREGVTRIAPDLQGALVSMDVATGDLLAMVGGTDFGKSAYNRALFAKRQPGSAIKPFIYATALEKGITAASVWDDAPVTYNRGNNESWTPQNYGRERYGSLSLRQALAYSNNIIAVKLLETVGLPDFTALAEKCGLPLRARNDLSLALGTEEVTLSELVQAYSPFANGGTRTEARAIVRVYDRRTNTTSENQPLLQPAIPPAIAFVTTKMLQDVMTYGTAKGLKHFREEHPSAGKTGTTDDYRDAWFIGYTPQLVTGIWVGYDKPRSGGKGFTGGAIAAPIWERFMKTALAGKPVVDFPQPETVESVLIDPETGYPAEADSPEKRVEFFIREPVPTDEAEKRDETTSQPPVVPLPEAAPATPAPSE